MVPEEFLNALGATKEASQIAMLVKDVQPPLRSTQSC